MCYIVIDNLYDESNRQEFETRNDALEHFWQKYESVKNDYPANITLRNEVDKPARGTIIVNVDGFFRYVELIKKI